MGEAVRTVIPLSRGRAAAGKAMVDDSPAAVVWLDPGLLTGWAIWTDDHQFTSGQLGFEDLGFFLEADAEQLGPDMAIGWEQYIVTQGGGKAGTPKHSLKVIGMVEWLCLRHGVNVLASQPSASRKLGGDLQLKRLGWYRAGKRHANDAASHLLSWLIREGTLPSHLADKLCTST